MLTNSARAAFHRLAARAHDRLAPWLPCPDAATFAARVEEAQSRTDNAWSATNEDDTNIGTATDGEGRAADEASIAAEDGRYGHAANWHRRAAKAARGR